jgi:acylphosphatase
MAAWHRFAATLSAVPHQPVYRRHRKEAQRRKESQRIWFRTENVTICNLMTTAQIARRYLVSGIVQGVGFRYFTQDEAERLRLSGFVRNLRDGRVEVYAIGLPENLARLRTIIERGPRGAMVQHVAEESAEVNPEFAEEFSITYDQ